MDFDKLWKCESVRIAAMEQLEIMGKLDTKTLFARAKDIYNRGYEKNVHKWKSIWKEEKKPVKNNDSVERPSDVQGSTENTKKCPSCGEMVPKGFKKHLYTKDGSKCGYEFP